MSQLFNTNNPGIGDVGGITTEEALILANLASLTYSPGGILYIDSGGNFTNLGIGTEGQVLRVTSGFPVWGTGGSYTDEEAQDAVGNILVDSDSIDFTYSDATPSITASLRRDVDGSLVSSVDGIALDGDAASPGNSKLYGTNASGIKGWYNQPSGGVGGISQELAIAYAVSL